VLGANIAATIDPSHFFWMGMDAPAVVRRLGARAGHAHAKDVVFRPEALALNGLLDRRWPAPAEEMPWNFAVAGRGHDAGWWRGLIEALTAAEGANSISIEHEDPFVPPERGIIEAARFLAAIMGGRA
jgi:sugar phosphate isomerase/epimerase